MRRNEAEECLILMKLGQVVYTKSLTGPNRTYATAYRFEMDEWSHFSFYWTEKGNENKWVRIASVEDPLKTLQEEDLIEQLHDGIIPLDI